MILPPPPSDVLRPPPPPGWRPQNIVPVLPPPTTATGRTDGRDERGWWVKGHAPNPGGRPAVAAEVKKLARSYGPEAIEKLVYLMRHSLDERTQKAAADSLLDRGYGRPVQQIEAGGPGAFDGMTDDELNNYVKARSREIFMGTLENAEP